MSHADSVSTIPIHTLPSRRKTGVFGARTLPRTKSSGPTLTSQGQPLRWTRFVPPRKPVSVLRVYQGIPETFLRRDEHLLDMEDSRYMCGSFMIS